MAIRYVALSPHLPPLPFSEGMRRYDAAKNMFNENTRCDRRVVWQTENKGRWLGGWRRWRGRRQRERHTHTWVECEREYTNKYTKVIIKHLFTSLCMYAHERTNLVWYCYCTHKRCHDFQTYLIAAVNNSCSWLTEVWGCDSNIICVPCIRELKRNGRDTVRVWRDEWCNGGWPVGATGFWSLVSCVHQEPNELRRKAAEESDLGYCQYEVCIYTCPQIHTRLKPRWNTTHTHTYEENWFRVTKCQSYICTNTDNSFWKAKELTWHLIVYGCAWHRIRFHNQVNSIFSHFLADPIV